MQWLNQWPDLTDTTRWIPARLTTATDQPVGPIPVTAVAAIETAYTDTSVHALVCAWQADDGRIEAHVTLNTTLPQALEQAGTAQVWCHTSIAETIGPTRWGVHPVTAAQARAATATLRDLVHAGRLRVTGMPDEQWANVVTTQAEDGHHIDGRKSSGDTHGVKALSWAVWAVESGRSHSGFLFGDTAPEAQTGAPT